MKCSTMSLYCCPFQFIIITQTTVYSFSLEQLENLAFVFILKKKLNSEMCYGLFSFHFTNLFPKSSVNKMKNGKGKQSHRETVK